MTGHGDVRRVIVDVDAISIVDAPLPVPEADEVLVTMVVTGVCGSDIHAAAGHHPFINLPYAPGHEVVGVVKATGHRVTGIRRGDRVTVEPTLPCRRCKMCRTDRSNICERLRFFGCGYGQGGMADAFTVAADRLHVIPDDVGDLDAALIEPLATPVHAERLSGGVEGKTVVIIGAGTIGLLTLAATRYAGARRIVMTDMIPSKRARARRLGADAVFGADAPRVVEQIRAELGESADVVFDCVSTQSTVDQAVRLASKGGVVMIVGVPVQPVTVPLPEIQDLQVRVQGSATYMSEDYERAIEVIRAGHAQSHELITAQFPLERVSEAFAAAASGDEVKVVLTP